MKIMIGPCAELFIIGILKKRRHDTIVTMDYMRMPPHSSGSPNSLDHHGARDIEGLDENVLSGLKTSGVIDQQFSKLGFARIVHCDGYFLFDTNGSFRFGITGQTC